MDVRQSVKRLLNRVGYETLFWQRVVMYRECSEWLRELGPENLDCAEISASERGDIWREMPWRSFSELNYPEFDVCVEDGSHSEEFDVLIADQVFEHLLWPYRAARRLREMLTPGGNALVTVPFMLRVHEAPVDCSRWTETGLKYLLAEAGFELEKIRTGSWGNRACVKANFGSWARRGWFGSLKNEERFPVAVWALAQK